MTEAAKEPERELWDGHPSQWMAFKFYVVCVFLIAALVGASAYAKLEVEALAEYWYYPALGIPVILLVVLIRFFIVRTTHYRLTNERLLRIRGIFSRDSEEIELYRIRDWSVIKPFWLRLTGRGHVRVISTDATAPDLLLEGITKPEHVRELMRRHVETARDAKRVRQVDIDGGLFD